MSNSGVNVTLVIPVYRDVSRLRLYLPSLTQAINAMDISIHFMIVDDGSGPLQQTELRGFLNGFNAPGMSIETLFLDQHLGKGGAVVRGWRHAPDSDWLAFVDADGSVSARELIRLFQCALKLGSRFAVIASRMPSPHTRVTQSVSRKVSGRLFAWIARRALRLECRDPQCGAKVIPSSAFQNIAPRICEKGLAFDVELLARLNRAGIQVKEIPVNWTETPGGAVKPWRDAWPMLLALWRTRKRLKHEAPGQSK